MNCYEQVLIVASRCRQKRQIDWQRHQEARQIQFLRDMQNLPKPRGRIDTYSDLQVSP